MQTARIDHHDRPYTSRVTVRPAPCQGWFYYDCTRTQRSGTIRVFDLALNAQETYEALIFEGVDADTAADMVESFSESEAAL